MEASNTDEQKRTIMTAIELLENRALALTDLARMSETVVARLNRTEGQVKESPDDLLTDKAKAIQPDLIELIENIANGIQRKCEVIGSNLERTIHIIE